MSRTTSDELFPTTAVADRSKGRLLFVLALIAYAAVDVWLLRWVPVGSDTGDYWHIFYTWYTELFFNNDFSHWLPYGGYGQPNGLFTLMEVSSTDYLMMFAGKLLHVRNALLLFQLSLAADHVLFLFGTYLLSRMLFKRTSSVVLSAIGSLAALHGLELAYIQVFRILSWYPLIVYFAACFFRDRQPEKLWTAGILFALWCLGTAYMPTFMILAVAPFIAVASWKHPRSWRSILSLRARNLAMMTLCASVVLLYLYLIREVMVGIDVTKAGRSSAGLSSVTSYIGPTRTFTPFSTLVSLYAGNIFYVGLLPIACVTWGLFGARSIAFIAFAASALTLVWFSLGGLFSLALFYYAPFVARTRYLFLGFYLLRAPLLLAAAAAWDVLSPSKRNVTILLRSPVIVILLIDLCLYGDGFLLVDSNARTFAAVWTPVYLRLAVYGIFTAVALIVWYGSRRARIHLSPRWSAIASPQSFVAVALLAALFVDVFQYTYKSGLPTNKAAASYREAATAVWSLSTVNSVAYQAGRVRRLRWQPERLSVARDEMQDVILQVPSYYHTYAYAQFDPCEFSTAPIVMGASIAKLLALRENGDRALLTILGCEAPKLRIVTNALYVHDERDAATAVQRATDLAETVILELPRDAPRAVEGSSTKTEHPGTATVTTFAANALTASVHVEAADGAWLVYADAYDPRWRAWVNERPTPIVPAYVGLKAVRVPNGDSVVRMEFSGAATTAITVVAFAGAICSLSLLGYCAFCCVGGFPASRAPQSYTRAGHFFGRRVTQPTSKSATRGAL